MALHVVAVAEAHRVVEPASCEIIEGEPIEAGDSAALPRADLRGGVQDEGPLEAGNALAVELVDLCDVLPERDLDPRQVSHIEGIGGNAVVQPRHIVPVGPAGIPSLPEPLPNLAAHHLPALRLAPSPGVESLHIDSADPRREPDPVIRLLEGGAGPCENIAVAGSIDEDLARRGQAAGLRLKGDRVDSALAGDRVHDPGVKQKPDAGGPTQRQ